MYLQIILSKKRIVNGKWRLDNGSALIYINRMVKLTGWLIS